MLDRRREHRRHQLHRLLGDKRRDALSLHIRKSEGTVKAVAESAVREVVGRTPIAAALAEGRGKIENDTQKLLQEILDSYGGGITVTQVQLQEGRPPAPVIDAFRDVQRARADQERKRKRGRGLSQQHPAGGARRRRSPGAGGRGL